MQFFTVYILGEHTVNREIFTVAFLQYFTIKFTGHFLQYVVC